MNTEVAIFTCGDPEPELRSILSPEAGGLEAVRKIIGGQIDIGMGVGRSLQYAVHEWSHGTTLNEAASEALGRPAFGTVVVWGVGPGGSDRDYSDAD